jgi:glutathione synthase/RimK-type ligase-like ATP-grasp enzyme
MKKILILGTPIEESHPDMVMIKYLQKQFEGRALVEFKYYPETIMELKPGQVEISFGESKARDYDLIWIRKTGEEYSKMASALGVGFDLNHIRYFDTCFGVRGIGGNKLLNMLRIAVDNLPLPVSYFCWADMAKKKKNEIINKFGFPMMGKTMNLHWGGGVYLLHNEKEWLDFVGKSQEGEQLIFQEFHPHKGDYRILVLGYQVGAWEMMYREPDLSPSWEGSGQPVGELKKKEFFPVKNIPPEMAKLAIRAAKSAKLEIAGVDIFQNAKTKEYVMTEINRTPGFAADYVKYPELKAVTDFLKREAGV